MEFNISTNNDIVITMCHSTIIIRKHINQVRLSWQIQQCSEIISAYLAIYRLVTSSFHADLEVDLTDNIIRIVLADC